MSTDRVRLRYTGERPVSFLDHCIGSVKQGDEFSVPAGEEERFTRRADVELADAAPAVKARAKAAPREEAGASESA